MPPSSEQLGAGSFFSPPILFKTSGGLAGRGDFELSPISVLLPDLRIVGANPHVPSWPA